MLELGNMSDFSTEEAEKEDHKFEASLSYTTIITHQKTKQNKKDENKGKKNNLNLNWGPNKVTH